MSTDQSTLPLPRIEVYTPINEVLSDGTLAQTVKVIRAEGNPAGWVERIPVSHTRFLDGVEVDRDRFMDHVYTAKGWVR